MKSVGGKASLLPQLAPHLPLSFKRYHEPFVGGGAVFFYLASQVARSDRWASLSDWNTRLIRTYRGIRDAVDATIVRLRTLPTDRTTYERVRDWPIDTADEDALVATWYLYLNKLCFNGLFRVNRKGVFNVPYGKYENIVFDYDNIRAASGVLQQAHLEQGDFEEAMRWAKEGDLVYLDSPYLGTFTAYTENKFTLEDQERLRRAADRARARGAHVVVSNSSAARAIWESGWTIHELSGRRSVSCKPDGRQPVMEILVTP